MIYLVVQIHPGMTVFPSFSFSGQLFGELTMDVVSFFVFPAVRLSLRPAAAPALRRRRSGDRPPAAPAQRAARAAARHAAA